VLGCISRASPSRDGRVRVEHAVDRSATHAEDPKHARGLRGHPHRRAHPLRAAQATRGPSGADRRCIDRRWPRCAMKRILILALVALVASCKKAPPPPETTIASATPAITDATVDRAALETACGKGEPIACNDLGVAVESTDP